MKKVLLFAMLLLPLGLCAQSTDVPNMLTGNSNWMYRNTEIQYDKKEDRSMGGSADCMYDDCRIPKEMMNGRDYSVLRRVTAPAGICALENIYQYHVREAEVNCTV